MAAFGQSSAKSAASPAKASAETTSAAKPGNLPSEQTVNDFLFHTFGYESNLKYKVAEIKPADDPSMAEVTIVLNTTEGQQVLKLFVTPDQKYALSGDLLPFGADPFAVARGTLQKNVNGPTRGPANAAVTIVEFGDLQCPVCKRAQPTIEKLMTDVPNAKLVFQQFPLAQIHRWAMAAAKYSLCVAKQNNDAYWKFIDIVYQHQDELQPQTEEQVVPKLKQYAADAGVNADQVEQCTKDPEIAIKINDSIELGRAMDVTGTPTLFIGGRKIGNVAGIPYETLKAITTFQASNK
jgi:protein-disulfide isomerase